MKPKKRDKNPIINCANQHFGYYDICMMCTGTDETFIKFKEMISSKIQTVPIYDKSKNIIGFTLYNNEPQDINHIYEFVYEVIRKCSIKNVNFTREVKLILKDMIIHKGVNLYS